MSTCLVCGDVTTEVISFGRMPLGNAFLGTSQFAGEYFWDLEARCCPACSLVQLKDPVQAQRMFNDTYPFFSSSSDRMVAHFKALADWLRPLLPERAFVVEIGSNDGSLLQHLATPGTRVLGVEPSANVAAVATRRGLPTLGRFFDAASAREMVADHGRADAVTGTNVFCHIPGIGSVFEGCDILLRPRGLIVFEDPYWGDVVANTAYDQIYDEHVFYFSVTSVSRLARRYGFELIGAGHLDVHGGSMRYVLARTGVHQISERVERLLAQESAAALTEGGTFEMFRVRIERSRTQLVELLQELHGEGARLAGYAATSKSTTVLNYCGIGPELIPYVSDSTPAKQGLYTPGMHIPVTSPEHFRADAPDYAVLFAWNHAAEIAEKEQAFADAGRRWITYVPRVVVAPVPVVPEHHVVSS